MNCHIAPDVAQKMLYGIMRIRLIEERIRDLYADRRCGAPSISASGRKP